MALLHTFLFLLLFYITTASYGCLVWRNSYLYYKNDSDYLIFNFFKSPRSGSFGLGFGNTNSVQNMTNLYNFSLERVDFYQSHFNLLLDNTSATFIDNSVYYNMDNILKITFFMNRTLFESFKFIFFAEMEGDKHINFGWKVSPFFEANNNYEEGWCDPRYLGKLPGRLFSAWFWSMIPFTVFSIIVIILCIKYRDSQPLKSRGEVGPILSIIAILINGISDYTLVNFYTYDERYYLDCFVNSLLLYPSLISLIPVSLFYYLRFISLVNINTQRVRLSNEDGKQTLPLFFRLLLKLTRVESFVISSFLVVSSYYLIIIIIFSSTGWKCGNIAPTINRVVFAVYLIGVLAIIFLLILADFIQNFKVIFKCKLKDFFIKSDPFFFRLNFLLSPFIMVVIFIWILPVSYPSIIKISLVELAFIIGTLLNTILPLLISMISQLFTVGNNQNKRKSEIENLFENEELYRIFLQFSQNEWSMENVICKKLIKKYNSTTIGRRKIVMDIYHKFLLGELFEINIKEDLKLFLIQKIKIFKGDNFPNGFFNELEEDVMVNLSDIYARFRVTQEYHNYQSKIKILELTENK